MRALIVAAFVAFPLPARAQQPEQPAPPEQVIEKPAPLTGNPGWAMAGYVGVGAVMLETAGGNHLPTPELAAHGSIRVSDLVTMRGIYDYSWRRDGASRIYVDNTYHAFTYRIDLTFGTDRTQFVAGAGPSMIVATTRLHGSGRNVHANDIAPGLGYGVGLRWMWGRAPWAIDFSGQQRSLRHDFRATLSLGLPLLKSRKEGSTP